MGLFAILPCLVATLLILDHAANGSDNFVVTSTRRVSVRNGHTVTLPCWLTPTQSAEALEVLWYHNYLDSPLIHYKGNEVSSSPSYGGRVSFVPRGKVSAGLALGNMSLELVNVTLQDSGEYTCYVSSDQNHDSASVTLTVIEIGGPLHLSAVWTDNNVVNVSCWSKGWYPKPYLRWSDQKGALTPEIIQHAEESSGLLSVHSWALVNSSSEIICTLGLQDGEEKQSRLHLSKLPQNGQRDSNHSATAGLAALAVVLVITTTILGIAFYKIRAKKIKLQRKNNVLEEEKQRLLIKDKIRSKKNYVNISISIPEREHPYLLIRNTKDGYVLRDKNIFPEGSKVSCLTAITGTPGFSSGEHYWEVSLENQHCGLKMSWWIGITNVCKIPENAELSPTASKGYWFLSSSSENPDSLQLSTEPARLLPVTSKPQTVGVDLNCERGEVTFYNVEDSSIIGSLKDDFQGEVFPFFNPGLFDKTPLIILHKNLSTSSNEETVALDPEKQ